MKSFDSSSFDNSSFDTGLTYVSTVNHLLWNNKSYVNPVTSLVFNNKSYAEKLNSLVWSALALVDETLVSLVWDGTNYVESGVSTKWDNSCYITSILDLIWGEHAYNKDIRFDHGKLDASSFDRGTLYVSTARNLLWNNREFTPAFSNNLVWNNRDWLEKSTSLKWNNRVFTSETLSELVWNNRMYVPLVEPVLKWNNTSYLTKSLDLVWINRMFLPSSHDLVWSNTSLTTKIYSLIWNNISGIAWSLADYLDVTTVQNQPIYPEIVSGKISLKNGSIGEATLYLNHSIPEDAKCTLYLKGNTRVFDGISRRCVRNEDGLYVATIQEYTEILKPENGKGGLYLAKNTWHDVKLLNLLSSNKPTENDDEVGLLYMSVSAIPWSFFKEYDETNYIYSWTYSGIPYNITEVFEDYTVLTQKSSATDLTSSAGWYHDTINKVFYLRCSDNTSPYAHVISVPYIWDSNVPVRLGDVRDKADTVIAYWETANLDVPITNVNTLLTALELESESVVRNGVCYINVAEKVGNGSAESPANTYREDENITEISEIDMTDARFMINGAIVDGFGSGPGQVHSAKHINMGRGGRFAIIDDSTIHSSAIADDYAERYLDEKYLPARSITFTAPFDLGKVIDQRRIGDTAHVSIPSEYFEQDLRLQEILINLKPLSQELTFGDRLISYDDQMKAMQTAAEKYRTHLAGEVEEFTWSQQTNLDASAARTFTFDITDDALAVQKMVFSASTDFHTTDTSAGSGDGQGGGGGGSGEEGGTAKPVTGTTHHHTLSGVTGGPSASVSVATLGHTHTYSATTGGLSGTVSVVGSVGDPVYGCCTAVGCGKEFVESFSAPNYQTVASSIHTHTVSGTSSSPSATVSVSTGDHTHTLTSLQTSDAEAGTATWTQPQYIDQFTYKDQGGVRVNVATGLPWGKEDPSYNEDPDYRYKGTDVYTMFRGGGNPVLDPEMYISVKLSGPGITGTVDINGSPFTVKVLDSIGPELIDDLVTKAGTYTITLSTTNKSAPTESCYIKLNMQVQGRIFVDTIVKE